MKRKRLNRLLVKRIFVAFLSVCMLMTGMPMSVLASEAVPVPLEAQSEPMVTAAAETHTTCNHVHDETCGYVEAKEAVDGQPCTFVHEHDAACGYVEAQSEVLCDQGCSEVDEDGTIIHAENCAYRPAVAGQPCTFVHKHDAACGYVEAKEAIEGRPCNHIHDEACGGLPAAPEPGTGEGGLLVPCAVCGEEGHETAACPVESLKGRLAALPELTEETYAALTEEEQASLKIQVEEIEAAYAELSEVQKDLISAEEYAKAEALKEMLAAKAPLLGAEVSPLGSHSHGVEGEVWLELTAEVLTVNNNALPAGNYYLGSDVTVPDAGISITQGATVTLCLSGYTLNCKYLSVDSGAKLTIEDCSGSGKLLGTYSSYVIYNNGTLYVHDGSIGDGNNITAIDNSDILYLQGGSICGSQYGVNSSYSRIYLSGAPEISGGKAAIRYNDGYYLNAGDGENYYNGAVLLLEYADGNSISSGYTTAVSNLPEETEGAPLLFKVADEKPYEIRRAENGNRLVFYGKPQTLTWYAEDGTTVLTGDNYPTNAVYNESITTMPVAETAGKTFLGWQYRKNGVDFWSTEYWNSSRVQYPMEFKACYVDSLAGDGTKEAPYLIGSLEDLEKVRTMVNSGNTAAASAHYKLNTDIDLSAAYGEGKASFTPIGTYNTPFRGTFDGAGKTISNLYISGSDRYAGLFASVNDGTIENLMLTGAYVSTDSDSGRAGVIAGYIEGNAKVAGCTLSGQVFGGDKLGAIAGEIDNGVTLENNHTEGVVTCPYGYTTDDSNIMGYKKDDDNTIDIKAKYKDNWIQTTYSNRGYTVSSQGMSVVSNAEFINDGRYIKLSYMVTADAEVTDGKLAVCADTMIGDNDRAMIEVIKNRNGEVIGLGMVDDHTHECTSKEAQFNLYFDGTGGVTPVTTYWFGYYDDRKNHLYDDLNTETQSSRGTYGDNYTSYANYDSGMAWSWQNITLTPGETKTFSVILGVGERSEPPAWGNISTAGGATPVTLTMTAEAEQKGKVLDVTAKVSDAAGLTDNLYYSVNGGTEAALGRVEADGTQKLITSQLDLNSYEVGEYTFQFWIVNSKGAASESVEKTITINADGSITGLDVLVDGGNDDGEVNGEVDDETAGTTVTVDQSSLEGALDNIQDLIAAGNIVKMVLTVENKTETALPQDKTLVEGILSSIPATEVGAYFDIQLEQIVTPKDGTPTTTEVRETDCAIKITITIPENIRGGSNYQVIRVHDGSAEALPTVQNGVQLTFESKLFSTYAIAYTPSGENLPDEEDKPAGGNSGGNGSGSGSSNSSDSDSSTSTPVEKETMKSESGKDEEPKTGDTGIPVATLAMVAGMTYVCEIFCSKKGIRLGLTEAQKNRAISLLVKKAKGKNKLVRYTAITLIFLILAFYHSIGKVVEVDMELA